MCACIGFENAWTCVCVYIYIHRHIFIHIDIHKIHISIYKCMCVYAHISIIVCIIHIYIGWLQGYYASSILNIEVSHCSQRIFYCESCRIRAQHIFLSFGIWELIKVWNWNLGGPSNSGITVYQPRCCTHMLACSPWYIGMYVYMCANIYIACLRKSGTLFGFLIWILLYWGSDPYIIYQSIYRSLYLSMHLTTNIYICIYIYIHKDIRMNVCTCICSVWIWVTYMYIYIYVCVCVCLYMCIFTYTHICIRSWYIYIHNCRMISRLVCIFCHKYRSLSMFATHLLLSKLLFQGRICISRYWNLGTNDDFQ